MVKALKIIFEGPELAGKSYLMSQVYNFIEPKYNSGGRVLDGCHWFNCDVGLFGTAYGEAAITKYLELVEILSGANVMIEKFHLSEAVYQMHYHQQTYDFSEVESRLEKIGAKIILVTVSESEELIKERLADRLRLYPHYAKIAQSPSVYLQQQKTYLDLIKKSQLEYLVVDASTLPNEKVVNEILKFLKET